MRRRRLGVNVDHIATLRQARGTLYPDPVAAAMLAEQAGADQITVHLREDRRHIQERDVLNLEMAATASMQALALEIKPDMITLVPESRHEITTEGGLNVCAATASLKPLIATLQQAGMVVSLFIDADLSQVQAAHTLGCQMIELHTGRYCDAACESRRAVELQRIVEASDKAQQLQIRVAAGHGLHYHNIQALVPIEPIEEYNIGHSIVAQATAVGMHHAVAQMLQLLQC